MQNIEDLVQSSQAMTSPNAIRNGWRGGQPGFLVIDLSLTHGI
jgi:hypothetical protein